MNRPKTVLVLSVLFVLSALRVLAAPSAAAPPAKTPAAKPAAEAIPAPADVAAPPADAETTASGLASKVLQAGTGTFRPELTDSVKVHYTGWTVDGKMFDSSVSRGRPITFPLNAVIPGWREGVQLMVEGEKRRLWIPAKLAYEGVADRPQGMLVFDVELLDILRVPPTPPDVTAAPAEAQKSSSGLAWKVLIPGTGTKKPSAGSIVRVHYTGWTTDGKMFDSSLAKGAPAVFKLTEVIPGWTEGLQLMTEGEVRRFWVPKALAYRGAPGKPEGMLVFDVELIEITKP
ncbi:MAG TPA: FKBP-type peptidyl-prolyl cis-trans isomerase [Thermoanaerobaculia bacterium]|jgi:peptidylprolyl isomerase|nr:FKBP-type peptidyl-prolyl cis-trans isomerase [Thermoanaerobaculia bacterium]